MAGSLVVEVFITRGAYYKWRGHTDQRIRKQVCDFKISLPAILSSSPTRGMLSRLHDDPTRSNKSSGSYRGRFHCRSLYSQGAERRYERKRFKISVQVA